MSILTIVILNLALAFALVVGIAALMIGPLRARRSARVTALKARERQLRSAA
jgi:hypothetical protein